MAYKWATTFAFACFACAASDGSPPAVAGNPDGAAIRPDAAASPVDARVDPSGPDGASTDAALGPAADPARPGPFAAGVRTVMMTDPSRSRTFAVDIWYPVDPATGGGRANEYQLQALGLTLASLSTPARRDATPAAGGPWPLVIFSHGYGGVRFQSFFLTEQLATHGFVVAAPDHPGNTMADLILGGGDAAQSAIDRPLDVLFVLEKLLAGTAGVAVTIDGGRVGSTGHSFGGWTALEVARRDPRFRAVFPMAPGFRNGATPDFVADLARPIALFGGSLDHTCEFEANQRAPYNLAAPPKYLVEIMGAGHLDFSDLCEVPLAVSLINDGCNAQNVDPAIVRARTSTLATAFAKRWLDADMRYDAYLDASYVMGLGNLEYWRQP